MKPVKQVSNHQLRGSLLELIEACPFDYTNPEDCPLSSVRQLPLSDRTQWFQALPEKDLVYLAAYHHICYATKTPAAIVDRHANPKAKLSRKRKGPTGG